MYRLYEGWLEECSLFTRTLKFFGTQYYEKQIDDQKQSDHENNGFSHSLKPPAELDIINTKGKKNCRC